MIMNEFDSLPIGSPAKRALAAAGIETLEDLTRVSEEELLQLHGMGPKAIGRIKEVMKERNLTFNNGEETERISGETNQKLMKRASGKS